MPEASCIDLETASIRQPAGEESPWEGNVRRSVLFLSALDFKEKSIQVIRKTPEAYVARGFAVVYIVARDISKYGNYFYEDILNPAGVTVHRFSMPFTRFNDRFCSQTVRTIIGKFRGYVTAVQLASRASRLLKTRRFDVIYGYGMVGVLAVILLRLFRKTKGAKHISRYLGIYSLAPLFIGKKYLKALLNWEYLLALYLPFDLCIMTNDGTQGDKALQALRSKSLPNLKFWVNGVDEQKLPPEDIGKIQRELRISDNTFTLVTVCRLEGYKRVDRGILLVDALVHTHGRRNILYFVVGDGTDRERLEQMVQERGLQEYVRFTGAVKNSQVRDYLNAAEVFLSTYDHSNVGNPLLEAIRANKIIFTLNNGDTGSWITHRVNGFIYDITPSLFQEMAADMLQVMDDASIREKILAQIKITERTKLWTWGERMSAEVDSVLALFPAKES